MKTDFKIFATGVLILYCSTLISYGILGLPFNPYGKIFLITLCIWCGGGGLYWLWKK